MGIDVMGTERFACKETGCACVDYVCVVDRMTDEERAMTIVHHPRNSPQCDRQFDSPPPRLPIA